eukprot:72009_1
MMNDFIISLLVIVLPVVNSNSFCSRIGLSIIIKNEESVLPRLLNSLKSEFELDYYQFCDTGSTDSTIEIIKEFLKTNNGNLSHHEWVNFGVNRNQCLNEIYKQKSNLDYILFSDADWILHIKNPNWKNEIEYDINMVASEYPDLLFRMILLINSSINCQYYGVIHEYLSCEGNYSQGEFNGFTFENKPDPEKDLINKWRKYEQLLLEEIKKHPFDVRNIFYLARTYEDLGEYSKAINFYRKRANFHEESWVEETWYSLYKIGYCRMLQGESFLEEMLS